MSKILTVLLVILFIPALVWGGWQLYQTYQAGFGAYTVAHAHSVETFASPIIKQALLSGFQATIALFILGIIAHVARKAFLANTSFALGVSIFAGMLLIGLLQYHHVTDLLSTIPPAPNIASREYNTVPDPANGLLFAYALTWKKGSSIPQEMQMYKTILQFYQTYFVSAYYLNFHLDTVPTKRCVEGVDTAYDLWIKQKHTASDTFSLTCTADPNPLNIKAITLSPGEGAILFK